MDPDLNVVLNKYLNELAAANHRAILATARAEAAEARLADLEQKEESK